jgi:flagellar biosynthesis chaperone FliJ
LEKESFEDYMATIQKLTNLAKERSNYMDRYQDNLTNWSRLHEEDTTLNGYLEELEVIVNE